MSNRTESYAAIEEIRYHDTLLAIIISSSYNDSGIHFFTPNDFSQQLAYMRHPAGKIIQPHIHKSVSRQIFLTQEVLVIKQGKLRVDFYSELQEYIESRFLVAGDVILLASGGHGFEVIEEVQMIEIKQGPYVGEIDKIRFQGIAKVDRIEGTSTGSVAKTIYRQKSSNFFTF